jgi:hypothetical protein
VYVATGDAPQLPVATYTSLLQMGSWSDAFSGLEIGARMGDTLA